MKSFLSKALVCSMALMFAAGIASVPAKEVKADVDKDITFGKTVAVDFKKDNVWWFKFDLSKETAPKFVSFTSTGDCDPYVTLFKGGKFMNEVGSDDNTADGSNFSLVKVLEPAVYYYMVGVPSDTQIGPSNNTQVTIKDMTDNTKVCDINSTNFPDKTFREYVDKNFDIKDDNVLTKDEISFVDKIEVYNKDVSSLKGIEYFTKLTVLSCGNNKLTSLDLSANKELSSVACYDNPGLKTINLKNCTRLTYLQCFRCALESIDLSDCKNLFGLHCYGNKSLKSLSVSSRNLYEIFCYNCDSLESLKVDGCTNLTRIACENCKIKSLDLSGAPKVELLECFENALTSLKLNDKIRFVKAEDNKDLKSIDISKCNRLQDLRITDTGIKSLDITGCPMLEIVYNPKYLDSEGKYMNSINGEANYLYLNPGTTVITGTDSPEDGVALNETNFPNRFFRERLEKYDANKDGILSPIELRTITQLSLSWSFDDLKGLELLKYVEELSVTDNDNLKKLDLSGNPNLEKLQCSKNKSLTSLDLSKNTKLVELECEYNKLKTLDLSKNKELVSVDCRGNELSSLDVSNNTKLENLTCIFNNITSLDISKNKDLEMLGVFGNKIKKLDIMNNPKLMSLCKNSEKQNSVQEGVEYQFYYDLDQLRGLAFDMDTVLVTAKPTPTPTATPKPTAKPTAKPTKAPAVKLTLNKKTANVTCGKSLTLKATLTGATSKISWKSSNTKIATVDASGKVKAKMAGTVTITATASGKSAKCKVTVLYKDVTNSKDFWYEPTNALTAKGVVKGYDKQTKFKPANNCTRAQMVTFIWRLMGEPSPKAKTCKFTDVKKTDYFYKACIWGNENHIVEGYKNGTFGPQIVCARRHAVTFLWRLAGSPKPASSKNKFSDVKKSDYFYKATLWASEKKILAGYSDGTFRPNGECLRRQMVTFLYKYDKFIPTAKK